MVSCRRIFRLLLIFSATTALCGCGSLGSLSPLQSVEKSLLYHPSAYPEDWRPRGIEVEDAWITSGDGTQLHGWFIDHPRPRAVALFLHGNAGHIASRAESLKILNQRHALAVLALDYRGYGRSEGSPSETGILADARAARAWLSKRKSVAETDIVLMGRSLGGGVAIDLAAKDSARGLVVASTFTSLPDVAAEYVSWALPHWNMTQRLHSLAKIPHYTGPLLISHGDADEVIPYEHGQKLFAAAGGPKTFITIPGGRHNSPQTEEYRQALDALLDSLPPESTAR